MSAIAFWFSAGAILGFGAGVIFAAWYVGRDGDEE